MTPEDFHSPHFDGTFNLGHLLTILSIVLTMVGGVWYVSAQVNSQQEKILEQNKNISAQLSEQATEIGEMKQDYVRRDIADKQDQMFVDRLNTIFSSLQAINRKLGLPVEGYYWKDEQQNKYF